MKIMSAFAFLFFAMQASASSYYCNGALKQSGSTWYYPNGALAQSGSTTYYENGALLKSGSTLYFRNGALFVSGSTMYYSNGALFKSGSSFYHANGSILKSGSSCYYENGSSMGTCPSSLEVQVGLGDNDLEADVNLTSGERSQMTHSFEINSQSGYIQLDGDGTVDEIQFECSGSSDNEVSDLLKNYQSLSSEQKTQVRKNICH